MRLSRYEQETIVNFNEADSAATVYTYNGAFKKKTPIIVGAISPRCEVYQRRSARGRYIFHSQALD